jgi:hypothetical protein
VGAEKLPWTPEDEAILYDGLLEGDTATAISARLGRGLGSVYNKIRNEGWSRIIDTARQKRPAATAVLQPHDVFRAPPTFPLDPVRPFAVQVRKAAAVQTGAVYKAVVYGDTHVPFHDPAALEVVKAVAKHVRPDCIVNVGDLVDAWQISRWDKDPTRKDTLQENIDESRQHLAEVALAFPKARRVLLEGNHEARLTKAIWKLEGAARELPKLRLFQTTMTWPTLLELDAIGWEWIGERDQTRTSVLPKIITKHGSALRSWSGGSARAEWTKYGASGLSGHSHRLGLYLHRDHNGTASWIETGCTCLLDPPYGTDYDWQQGCVVLTWNKDRRLMQTEFVSVRDGSALFRDKELVAA